MRIRLAFVEVLFCLVLLCGAAPIGWSAPSFTGLGALPGNYATAGGAVSADGSAVVGFSYGGPRLEAFTWNATDGMVGLGALPGPNVFSLAGGLSADGSVVVGYSEAEFWEAFIWDAGNGMQSLGLYPDPPGSPTIAIDVSSDGTIVVGLGGVGTGSDVAIRWDAANGYQSLGYLPGATRTYSAAFGISGDGSTIVGRGVSANNDPQLDPIFSLAATEAFTWDAVNGMQGIGDLPGGGFGSAASGVNPDGSIVVGRSISASGEEAFIWDAINGMRGLGDLPGGGLDFDSGASDVSADGRVVVGAGSTDEPITTGTEAFIWDPINGMQLLQDALTDLGLDTTGWVLKGASSVSDDGQTIAGTGINPAGFEEVWVAVIPEPSTGLLVAIGVAVLGMRRHARVV